MAGQLVARNLIFRHGPVTVLEGVSITVAPGDRIGIVGPNGVGKSTLLRLLAGQLEPVDGGSVERHPSGMTVDLLTQEPEPTGPGETVGAHLRRRVGLDAAEREFEAAAAALGSGEPGSDDRYSAALDRYLHLDVADGDARIDEALVRVGLPVEIAERPVAALSGGQATKVGLAAIALAKGDVLLLDEPTNNVDTAGLALLEQLVRTTPAGVVLVSHDRAFLEATVTAVVEIDEHSRGSTRFDGGWAAYQAERATSRRHAEEAYATFDEKRQHLTDRAQREREWASQGVKKAKKDTSEKDKNIRSFKRQTSEQLAGKARRTEQAISRLDAVDKPWEGWELRLTFAAGPKGGGMAASLHGAVAERGTFRLGPIDLDIAWGERVAIAGANGSGKTTLLAALLGDLPLVAGTRRVNPSVVLGRLDQARDTFSGTATVLEAFMEDTGVDLPTARSALAKLGLDTDKVRRPAERLSPGERTRAVLAAFAIRGVNLLVLDEPTNHLDLPAIEQLEQALERFEGTVIVISHDRAFLDRVTPGRAVQLDGGLIVADAPV